MIASRVVVPALKVTTADGAVSTDQLANWELVAARRALDNLRLLLDGEPMLELLRDQMEAGDAFVKELVAASNGGLRECRVDIAAEGLSSGEFLDWWRARLAEPAVCYAAHPEHYAMVPFPAPDGSVSERIGVEQIGGHLVRVKLAYGRVPEVAARLSSDEYPVELATTLALIDGTEVFYAFHQFRDTPAGFELILRAFFPAAAADDLFEGHTRHFAVEFCNWIRAAAADLGLAA